MIKYLLTLFLSISILCPSTTYGWGIMMLAGGNGTSTASPAADNDFSGDANCTALWRFESGALTTDSKGGNTLTDHYTVGTNSTIYKEGFACAEFNNSNSEYFSITDANLDAGHPFKSGDSNKKITFCSWVKGVGTSLATEYLYAKYHTTGKRTFAIVVNTAGKVYMYIGYNSGDSYEPEYLDYVLTAGNWYHIGVTYQDSDKSYRIRVWNDGDSSVHEATGNTTNNINIEDASVTIGARGDGAGYLNAKQDELVVFNDIKSAAEIDKIRAGTYP